MEDRDWRNHFELLSQFTHEKDEAKWGQSSKEERYPTALTMENISKNRYKNILPEEHSRVILEPEDDFTGDYINASWIWVCEKFVCQGCFLN